MKITVDVIYDLAYELEGEDGENIAQDEILKLGESEISLEDAYRIMRLVAGEDGENLLQTYLFELEEYGDDDDDDDGSGGAYFHNDEEDDEYKVFPYLQYISVNVSDSESGSIYNEVEVNGEFGLTVKYNGTHGFLEEYEITDVIIYDEDNDNPRDKDELIGEYIFLETHERPKILIAFPYVIKKIWDF